MGRRMRDVDWSSTPLGHPSTWPASLRSALSICLGSSFPIALYWGPRLVLLYNDAWSPILGGKHPWALGREAAEVWPEIWDTIGPMFEQVMSTGDATYSEDQLLPMHRHGYTEECYFNYTFSPIRGEGQTVDGIFNAVIETTFRVIAERRSRLLRELDEGILAVRSPAEACTVAASALGAAPKDVPFCALYLADAASSSAWLAGASQLEEGSPALPPRIDFDADQAEGWPLGRVWKTGHIEVVADLRERFGFALHGGPCDEPARAALVAPLLTGATQHPAGFLIVGASPRRAADEEYRQFAESAASRVATAIANALAFEAERRRAEALAEIDRAKTVFFNNVSHEFRTPLALMIGPIEDGLADTNEPLPPAQRERQEVVRRNGIRLQKLVNALLDFARIEAGRTLAAFAATDLAELTTDLASSFRSAIEHAGLTFTVECPPLPQLLYVDEGMWEKVVLNLLSNAFKYTLSGSISITLRPGDDAGAVLQVRDTGIGIPHEELPRVFERFHRVEGAVGRTHEGSGIGLTLVHELVKLHGGTIAVASVPGEGSTFTVTIPPGAAHLPAEQVVTDSGSRPSRPGSSAYVEEALRWMPDEPARATVVSAGATAEASSRPRVLLADDNADMRDYVRRLLRDRYDVEVAADGVSALAAVRRQAPDLIISDVMMPLLDGFGLLRELRADAAVRHIPVIMLSARAGEESRVEGLEAGADDYLVKPFSAGELIAKVSGVLEIARLRRQTEHHLTQVNRELDRRVSELETLLDVLPIGIGIALDQECRDIRINPAFAGVLGLPIGANASKTAPPGERPESFRCLDASGREVADSELPMQRAARHGTEVRGLEFDVVHDDGRSVRLLEYAAPLFNEHGAPRGAVGAFVDITERSRIEARHQFLLQLEDAVRSLSEPDDITMASAHMLGTHLGVNRCAYADVEDDENTFNLTGDYNLDVPSIVGRYAFAQFGDECLRLMRAGLPYVVADADTDPRVDAVREAYRATNIRAVICVPVRKAGRFVAAMAVHQTTPRTWRPDEVTLVETVAGRSWESIERTRVTRTLRDSEERVRLAVEAARVGYWLWNMQTGEMTLDATCVRLFGLPANSVTSDATVLGRVHPDDVPALRDSADGAAHERGPYDIEFRVVDDDGSIRWLAGKGRLVRDRPGGTWLTGVNVDVTERKALDLQREQLLAREQAARADAEHASQLKDEFLATLSHELRTPLNAIFGWSHLLRDYKSRPDMLERGLSTIERNARVQRQLIEDLLDMSRIVSGKLRLMVGTIEVGTIIKAAIESILPAAEAKALRLDIAVDEPMVISADSDRLQQIVWNLLSNAVKFTPEGGVITVSARIADRHVELVVADSGVGIEASFIPHVFDRFRQADGTASRRFGGLGLGLSIVKQLVELHGGTVRVQSGGADQGASFVVRLPAGGRVELDEAARVRTRPSTAAAAPAPADSIAGVKVLVVDDDADTRDLAELVLTEHGARVTAAASAQEALDALQRERPDVMLSDIGMPECDGYELMARVRALHDPWLRDIPAAAFTAFARPQDRVRVVRAGFRMHVDKPVDPAELVRAVSVLRRPGAGLYLSSPGGQS